MISRRRFVQGAGVAGLGLLAACGQLPGQAAPQAPAQAQVPRIGYLGQGSSEPSPTRDVFFQSLRDLGYVDGQNIRIESRFTETQFERAPELAAELVGLPVDVLVVGGGRAVLAARRATDTIPIVMGFSSVDPVAEGLIASLARPGGNVTGVTASVQGAQFGAKRLELLRDALNGLTRVGVVWDEGDPITIARWGETRAAGETLGLQTLSLAVRGPDDVVAALEAAASEHLDALIVVHNALTGDRRPMIIDRAARSRLPAMYEYREWVSTGGLMAYGPSRSAIWYRAAQYVDKILKGAKPADLPVEQPREFDFVINLKTAQALGLTIPQHVLLQATEIIQ
ncbi:MAG TPA: ABC transporter substrate-binding protein [Chloroflexota bacterium]|jgi:putative ABC transport system substrate-binding protein